MKNCEYISEENGGDQTAEAVNRHVATRLLAAPAFATSQRRLVKSVIKHSRIRAAHTDTLLGYRPAHV